MSVWGELVERLRLRPRLQRVGHGEGGVHFKGRFEGLWLSLVFGLDGHPRLSLAREKTVALVADEAWRITRRGQVPGYRSPLQTGDAEFDAEVLLLAEDPYGPLALLDEVTRRWVQRFVQRGGWCSPDQVSVSAHGMARVEDAGQARKLVELAAKVLVALGPPTREALVDRALTDRLPRVREAARAALQGRIRPEEILPRLPSENTPAVVEQLLALRPNSARSVAAWVKRLESVPGPQATAALLEVLGQRLPHPAEAFEQLAERFAAGWRAGQDPPEAIEALVGQQRRALTALCTAARAVGTAQALSWLATLPPPQALHPRLELLDTLRAMGHPAADDLALGLEPLDQREAELALARLDPVSGSAADAKVAGLALRWPAMVRRADERRQVVRRLAAALQAPARPLWADRLARQLPPEEAQAVIEPLVAAVPTQAVSWLVALRTPDPLAARTVARMLGTLGDVRAEPRLLELLDHDVESVKLAAVEALGECGTLGAVEALERYTGFFSAGELKLAAGSAIDAIRERGAISPVGGLSDAGGQGGGLSEAD